MDGQRLKQKRHERLRFSLPAVTNMGTSEKERKEEW